jgi:predicted small lipoprotein YifL
VGLVHKPLFGFGRLAVVAAIVAAAGLSGCGRKGALDPPPTAALTNPQQQVPPGPSMGEQSDLPTHSLMIPPAAPQAATPPPPTAKRWFPLDFLLN